MISESFFVNHPVFLKYKRKFDWKKFRKVSRLKKAVINERIIEIPFAIEALGRLPEKGSVLDLGCMESTLPLFVAGLGYQVTGFDFREYPYQMPNFKFVQGDILDLPFDENTFDAVTCVSTIEHVGIGFYNDPTDEQDAPDRKGMLQVKKVLKPGGLLILSVPFGMAHVDHQQRVYDKKALQGLVDIFDVQSMRFFKNVRPAQGNNFWREIDAAGAESLAYESGTDCVACVSAVNKL